MFKSIPLLYNYTLKQALLIRSHLVFKQFNNNQGFVRFLKY